MIKLLQRALFLTIALLPRLSSASPEYPFAIENYLGSVHTYDCALCHASATCGCPTVVTPFGLSLVAFGAKGRDIGSLNDALDASRAREWDSDGDGLSDVSELLLGSDPNTAALDGVSPPRHGCSLHPARSSLDPVAFASFAALVLAWIRARGSRTRHGNVT